MQKFISLFLICCCALAAAYAQDATEMGFDSTATDSSVVYKILGVAELKNARTFYSIEEARRTPKEVYKLSLKEQDLKEIPDAVMLFTNLQVFDLSNNKLRELPTWFMKLNHLQLLNLYSNRIVRLPDNMSELTELHTLYLGSNRMPEIPAWIGGIGKLQTLDVSNNGLTSYEIERLILMIPRCNITH